MLKAKNNCGLARMMNRPFQKVMALLSISVFTIRNTYHGLEIDAAMLDGRINLSWREQKYANKCAPKDSFNAVEKKEPEESPFVKNNELGAMKVTGDMTTWCYTVRRLYILLP